jgi:predicted GIY-YIG superfamily endonuclease
VDDIFCCWTGSEGQLDTFLQFINSLKLLKRKQKKQVLTLNTSLSGPSVSKRKWCKIPFHNSISFKIANKFPGHKFRVSFYTPLTLSKALCANKDHIDSNKKSGVYEIQFECGATYVGQTGRSFLTRIKEHKQGCITGSKTSLFAKHLIDSNHTSEFDFKSSTT